MDGRAGVQQGAVSGGLETVRSVVIVEDDAGDALLVTEMLVDIAPGITLTHFKTLRDALDEWPAEADCALLDLGLPDAMGLSALDALLTHAPDVPIVVLTGRIDDVIGPQAVAAGAQDFLVKGQVDAAILERSLRYSVERARATVYQRDLIAAELRSQENTRLQRGLLPSPLLDTDEVVVAPFYRPGSERALLGGDFYDVVQTATGVHVLLGDVSGHGPDEAALGVALRIAWRALVLAGLPTSDVLHGVEQVLLAERNDDERFATVAMLTFDPTLRAVDVVSCGHPLPLVIRGDDVTELDARPLPMLSILEGRTVAPVTVPLDGEWGLLLFTDGLVEGRRFPGSSERFGVGELRRRLDALIAEGIPRADIAPTLLAAAEESHGGPLTDDVAVLLIGDRRWWR